MQSLAQLFNKSVYTSCYCEENVYLMCKELRESHPNIESYVVFLTNPTQKTFIYQQKNGHGEQHGVIWDYHVIFIAQGNQGLRVYDKDSKLWGCPFAQYYQKSLKPKSHQPPTLFRVIGCQQYIDYFASDRSHMMRNGVYIKPPPKYESIKNKEGQTMTLLQYLDCKNKDPKFGKLLDADQFLQFFNSS